MAKRILTADEKKRALAYAKKKWPDESVSVEDQTDENDNVQFLRVKTTITVMPKGWAPPNARKSK